MVDVLCVGQENEILIIEQANRACGIRPNIQPLRRNPLDLDFCHLIDPASPAKGACRFIGRWRSGLLCIRSKRFHRDIYQGMVSTDFSFRAESSLCDYLHFLPDRLSQEESKSPTNQRWQRREAARC